MGSPPHGRGKESTNISREDLPGITPAWAGKRFPERPTHPVAEDHPRVGGEKLIGAPPKPAPPGSPPRGRGKVVQLPETARGLGITPAWAGKRPGSMCSPGIGEDHPRVGGEKLSNCLKLHEDLGSPPRGRGKGPVPCVHRGSVRITPAWAGKRAAFSGSDSDSWDHPRVGGEKLRRCTCRVTVQGSPPHGRGKGAHNQPDPRPCRITPAQAGKR